MDRPSLGPAIDIISTGIAFLTGFYLAKIDDGRGSPVAVFIVVVGFVIVVWSLYRLIKEKRKPEA